MKMSLLIVAVLVAGTSTAVAAQSTSELTAYQAAINTPSGALAPILTNTLLDRLQNGASLAFRYSNIQEGDLNLSSNAFGLTGILPAGLGSSVSLTAGFVLPDCDDCSARLMLGAGGDVRLFGTSLGSLAASPLFTLSVDGELGYGNRDPGSFFSGYVGAPLALVTRGEGMRFVPFLTPGFVFAQESVNGDSNSGTGTMLGGGLGIYNMLSNVTVNVGAQHFFTRGTRNVVGLAVTIGGK
jgi:hypothetical protein